jgi:hypothetical protein
VADMARTLSGGETPVELITRLGLDHLRRLFGAGHPFALGEGKEQHWPSTSVQPLEIRVGSDPINRLTHR